MQEYTIVVPSRRRAHNMPILRSLLPSAVICVDEREESDYLPVVPEDKLLLHPPMDGLPRVMNWMMDEIKTPTLIVVDDDFSGVKCMVGSHRFIMDPVEVLAIIENAAQCCEDLGLSAFGWARTANYVMLAPQDRPIWPTGAIMNARGFMGAARHRHFAVDLHGRADVDWTLRTLLEDRCVYQDTRFYFDCGRVYSGRGGSVGLIDVKQFEYASRTIRKRWGKHISFKAPGFQKARDIPALSIRVRRANKAAQK